MLLKSSSYVGVVLVGLFITASFVPDFHVPHVLFGSEKPVFATSSLIFVGDIMLGRNVEMLSETHGMNYPFKNITEFIKSADVSVGNFEGTVPLVHIPTQHLEFKFSVEQKFVPELTRTGFDVLSLANNHGLDYGDDAYTHTRAVCVENNIECYGHPIKLTETSVMEKRVGDTSVGIIFLHTLFSPPDQNELKLLIENLRIKTDVQVAYVHWGVEYEKTHENNQEQLAHFLIDNGVDTVIGHHPHVVQDIELYKEKPIFYSLGNFIFDQYFSNDVQEAITVRMYIEEESITYSVVPITSIGTRSQPRLMSLDEQNVFFEQFNEPILTVGEAGTYPSITIVRDE